MVKRKGDKQPEPPGGRAAERLRMFEQARRTDAPQKPKSKQSIAEKERPTKGRDSDAGKTRRED
jgi:hypothetical protein